MTIKPSPFTFKPAPRPQSRLRPEDAERLTNAAADLGFARATSSLDTPSASQRTVAGSEDPFNSTVSPRMTDAAKKVSSLKFDVPDETWVELRRAALERRVTVKYLVLEALAAKGYAIDLSAVPEDGRRIR